MDKIPTPEGNERPETPTVQFKLPPSPFPQTAETEARVKAVVEAAIENRR